MFKLIALALGLAIGFGGGVYYSVHHPNEAANISAQEEAQFLKAQAQITEATKSKLDQIIAKQHQSGSGPGSSFLGGGSPTASVDPDLQDLQQKAQKQLDDLHARLGKLGK